MRHSSPAVIPLIFSAIGLTARSSSVSGSNRNRPSPASSKRARVTPSIAEISIVRFGIGVRLEEVLAYPANYSRRGRDATRKRPKDKTDEMACQTSVSRSIVRVLNARILPVSSPTGPLACFIGQAPEGALVNRNQSATGCASYFQARLHRRAFLQASTLGALGLSLSDYLGMQQAQGATTARAKSIIL